VISIFADRTGADARQLEIKVFGARESSGLAEQSTTTILFWSPDTQWIYFVHGFVREWNQETRWTSGGFHLGRIAGATDTPEHRRDVPAALDLRTLLYIAREEDGSDRGCGPSTCRAGWHGE